MKEYINKIETQTNVALVVSAIVLLIAIGMQCLYKFTDIITAPDLGGWVIYVATFLPVATIILYIVIGPYSKRQYQQIVALNSLVRKIEVYAAFMARLKTIVIMLSVAMAIVTVLVPMDLIMLICMALLVEMLVFRGMSSNPYSVKQRLQLTGGEMNELYGEDWEKHIK